MKTKKKLNQKKKTDMGAVSTTDLREYSKAGQQETQQVDNNNGDMEV